MLLSTVPARADDTAIGEPIMAAPPPPTIVYLSPPVAVWAGGALHAAEGVRPLYPAPLLCERSPCAVAVGLALIVSTPEGESAAVVVEQRRGVTLPWVTR